MAALAKKKRKKMYIQLQLTLLKSTFIILYLHCMYPTYTTMLNCTFMFSPSLKVVQLCVQRGNEGCHHGSPSDLHGNFVGLLHSGKSVDLLRIHTRHGCTLPLACQRGPSSPLLQLHVDMDPTMMCTYDFTF